MRIVQLAYEPRRRLSKEIALRNRVDEIVRDTRAHLLEQPRTLVRATAPMQPALQQPAAEHERERQRGDGDERACAESVRARLDEVRVRRVLHCASGRDREWRRSSP